ncbi:hypothetical protein ABK040_011115 [Willaertia magna]
MPFTDIPSEILYTILSFLPIPFKIKTMCSVDLLSKSFNYNTKKSLDLMIWKEMFELKFLQNNKLKNLKFKKSINYKNYYSILSKYLSLYYSYLQSQPKNLNTNKQEINFQENEEIAIIGNSQVGKTYFTKVFVSPFYQYRQETIECGLYTKQITVDNINCKLNIFEILGQIKYKHLRQRIFKLKEAFICMCDITKKESLYNLEEYLNEIIEIKNFSSNFSCIFCLNKTDLENHITDEEINQFLTEMIKKGYINRNSCKVLKTSVKDYINVTETFEELVRDCRIRRKCYNDITLVYELMEKLYLNGEENLLSEIQPSKYSCLIM